MNLSQKRSAFTLIELSAVVAIVTVLALLGLGSWQGAVDRARATECLGNLRTIGAASMAYAADNEMTLPVTAHQRRQGGQSWTLSLQPYAGGPLCFRCPCDENRTRPYTYVINDFLTPNPAGAGNLDYSHLNRLSRPGATVLFAEASDRYANSDHFHFAEYRGQNTAAGAFESQVAVERHLGGANYLFADGHVERLTWTTTKTRLSETDSLFLDPSGQSLDPDPTP